MLINKISDLKDMVVEREQEQRIMQQIYKMLLKKCPDTEIEEFMVQNFTTSKEKAKEEIRKINEN